jgi:hypothetical protein
VRQTDECARNPILRGYWCAVAQSRDVAPGMLTVTVLGEPLVLWRTADGALTAARDRCPHWAAPLSLGQGIAFDRRIGMEDKTMLERILGVLPLDVAATASVPADCPSLAWRCQFTALLQGIA